MPMIISANVSCNYFTTPFFCLEMLSPLISETFKYTITFLEKYYIIIRHASSKKMIHKCKCKHALY